MPLYLFASSQPVPQRGKGESLCIDTLLPWEIEGKTSFASLPLPLTSYPVHRRCIGVIDEVEAPMLVPEGHRSTMHRRCKA